jgi:multicomponent Na+:H+ antiporter subunit D
MNVAALGTAISFAKFIFLPRGGDREDVSPGFWAAMILLLGGLIFANVVYYEAYTVENIVKPLATIAAGWLAYWFVFRRSVLKLPRTIEEFDHQIGLMSLILILLFWMAIGMMNNLLPL